MSDYTNSIAGTPLYKEIENFRWKKPVIKEWLEAWQPRYGKDEVYVVGISCTDIVQS